MNFAAAANVVGCRVGRALGLGLDPSHLLTYIAMGRGLTKVTMMAILTNYMAKLSIHFLVLYKGSRRLRGA